MNMTELPFEILQLQKKRKLAHYVILATVLTTAINLLLLFTHINFYLPYDASLAYYLTFLGYFFDGYSLGTYTATGLVMALAVLGVWLVVWWMARTRWIWLIIGIVLTAVDTVFLLLFSLVFLQGLSGSLIPILLHGAVIVTIGMGLKAHNQLEAWAAQPPEAPETLEEIPT